jgi:hypothetical protein
LGLLCTSRVPNEKLPGLTHWLKTTTNTVPPWATPVCVAHNFRAWRKECTVSSGELGHCEWPASRGDPLPVRCPSLGRDRKAATDNPLLVTGPADFLHESRQMQRSAVSGLEPQLLTTQQPALAYFAYCSYQTACKSFQANVSGSCSVLPLKREGLANLDTCHGRFDVSRLADFGPLDTDSHIPCRSHTVLLPCRSDKGLDCVFSI